MNYPVFYLEGIPEHPKPGTTYLKANRSCIELHRRRISWSDIQDINIEYKVRDGQGSIGGAAAGALIAGEAGAIIGGMRNTKQVESYLAIKYLSDGTAYDLKLISRKADEFMKEYNRRKTKLANKQPITVKPRSTEPLLKRIAKVYFALYIIPYKAIKKALNKDKI